MNYTYRIYPDAAQQIDLLEWFETCRGVYNYALRELKDWIASRKCPVDRCSLEKEYIISADEPFPSYHRQQNNLPKAKKQFSHLGKVHSQVFQNTIRRLHDTWEAFQKGGHGFPRFKKFGQFKSFVFPQFKDNPINGFTIKLPKIGEVPINLHRPIPDGFKVKQVRVLSKVRRTQWYLVVTIESDVSVSDPPIYGRAIGIDLGLERFLTVSDGSFQERPKFFKSMQRKLKLLQSRAARKQKGSQNWQKAQTKVARIHHRIAKRRKYFHLKTAHKLCDQAQTIFAEDLNVKGLTRGILGKDCVDAAFGQFLSLTEWVCWKRGVYFAKVNPNGTSQTCPNCFTTVSKGLQIREYHCPECGYRTHRDCAAAEIVLHRGLETVVAQGLWGTETACQVGLSGVYDLDKWRGGRNAQS
ncbi:MAG: transposase [Okeania sp. SIO1H6]|nr:transposase [Okeania sp. SIO1H6]